MASSGIGDVHSGFDSIDESDNYSNASTTLVNDEQSIRRGMKKCSVILNKIPNKQIKQYYASLKPARKRKRSQLEYIVKKIDGMFSSKNEVVYKVLWKGFCDSECTYEPERNLINSFNHLRRYYENTFGEASGTAVLKEKTAFMESVDMSNLTGVEISYYLFLNDYCFEDLSDPNFKRKIEDDLDDISRCVACIKSSFALIDAALNKRGVVIATVMALIGRRIRQLESLAETQNHLNELEETKLYIENNVDLDHFPTNFTYRTEMMIEENLKLCEDPALFCSCVDCNPSSLCCGKLNDYGMSYRSNKKLRKISKDPIFECNKRCSCPSTCRNRVVGNGRKIELVIFKTRFRGWGVKAKEQIPTGTFVCEYMGELKSVASSGKLTGPYVFGLDYDGEESYCVDASHFGNVGRFVNHGCEPNAQVNAVWIDNLSRDMHRLAIFTNRNVKANEEILFDYLGGLDMEGKSKKTKCYCAASTCQMYLYNE